MISFTGTSLTFTPAAGVSGQATGTCDISDGQGGTYTGIWAVNVEEEVTDPTIPAGDPAPTTMQSSITQDGVTFNLDQAYPVGQYSNGNYFAHAPDGGQVVSKVSAAVMDSTTSNEAGTVLNNRSRTGVAVNPVGPYNAFDSYIDGTSTSYSSSRDVDPGNTGAAYTFAPGQTLVKSKSITTPNIYARPSVERFGR